jgi:hypothetical protein
VSNRLQSADHKFFNFIRQEEMATEMKVHRSKSIAVMHKDATQSSPDAADSSSDGTS